MIAAGRRLNGLETSFDWTLRRFHEGVLDGLRPPLLSRLSHDGAKMIRFDSMNGEQGVTDLEVSGIVASPSRFFSVMLVLMMRVVGSAKDEVLKRQHVVRARSKKK